MKNRPKIIFSLNKALEKRAFMIFRKPEKALPNELYFLLQKDFDKTRQLILSTYVDSIYANHKKMLIKEMGLAKIRWQKIAPYFFKQVDKLFKKYPWPRGLYKAHPSIWTMFPRMIKEKRFTFPVNQIKWAPSNLVIGHEMLHFLTYDYLQKKYNLKPSEAGSRDNSFWQFTENLNILIERSNFWKPLTKNIKRNPKPVCKKMFTKMNRIWNKKQDIDLLVNKILVKK